MKSISNVINQTMTTPQIAELCKKPHRNVMRSAKILADKGIIRAAQIDDRYNNNNLRKIYLLNKTESINLVANLSPEFTAAIIDRWQELEQVHTIRVLPPQLLRYTERKATVPIKHFIPFEIITLELTLKLAQDGHDMFREMMPESSFVRGWNQLLRAQGEHIEAFPTHSVYTSQGKQVQERTYPMRLWESANNHFWDTWMPEKAPKYLRQRQPQLLPVIPVVINDLQDKLNAFLLPAPQARLF